MHLLTIKLQYAEENNYLQEELIREQNKNKEIQNKFNQVNSDKNYFMMKYKKQNPKKKEKEDGLFKKFTVLR